MLTDYSSIIVAVIALASAVTVGFISNRAQRKSSEIVRETSHDAVIAEMYDELTRNQGDRIKHLEGREKELETKVATTAEQLSSVKSNFEDKMKNVKEEFDICKQKLDNAVEMVNSLRKELYGELYDGDSEDF